MAMGGPSYRIFAWPSFARGRQAGCLEESGGMPWEVLMPASRKAWNRAGRNGPKGDPPGGGLKGEKAIDQ